MIFLVNQLIYSTSCSPQVFFNYTKDSKFDLWVIPAKFNNSKLKSSSNFYHLLASTREAFAENFSFIAQFSLTLWLFKVLQIVQKILVCKFLDLIQFAKKKLWKVVQLANFTIFFKLRCLLTSSKAQQTSHFLQHWRT